MSDRSSQSNHISSTDFYQLVHSIPGRCRYKVPLLKQHPYYAEKLQFELQNIPEITHIRINQVSQSLIIQYQVAKLTQKQLENILLSCFQPQGAIVYSLPKTAIEPSKDLTSSESKIEEIENSTEGEWSSLQLPATAALLALLSRFPRLAGCRYLAIVSLVTAALPIAQRAFQSLVIQRRLSIDCLDLLALSLSGWQGRLFTPAMVIVLHELGDVIREQTARATEVRTANLMDAIGHFAWVKVGEEQPRQIPSDRVQVGDTVVVYPGEQIPVDGIVIQGEAIIDQQSLTGESMPVVGQVGKLVFASTLVRSGQLYICAERVGKQTRAAASIELLQKAPVYDTRMANYAEKVAARLIFPSLLLASIVLLATRDPARCAAILTLDFVTGIRVSIPTAFLGALNHTTRHGILVRSGRTLEQLAEVDTIVFDKTGTLTQGRIAIVGVKTVPGGLPPEKVLQLAAAAEQRLNHPVAEAIVQSVQQQNLTIPARGEWSYSVGLGIIAQVEGHEILVGSQRFLQQQEINWGLDPSPTPPLQGEGLCSCDPSPTPPLQGEGLCSCDPSPTPPLQGEGLSSSPSPTPPLEGEGLSSSPFPRREGGWGVRFSSFVPIEGETEEESQSLIYVACDRQFQGVIQYSDPLRSESHTLIERLQRDYGINVHLLTGDNPQRAAQVAQELNIPLAQVYAEAFPEQKARIVRDLHRSGRTVAFVGDGLNDSVALAYADVSVSFEHGSEIARETADVVLMNNNLLDLLEAISIARQTRNLIEQNTALVVAPNLIALGLASTVGINPLIATAIHNGSAIAAGMNSLRPLLQHQMGSQTNGG